MTLKSYPTFLGFNAVEFCGATYGYFLKGFKIPAAHNGQASRVNFCASCYH